jgi:dienelactone hydrolase
MSDLRYNSRMKRTVLFIVLPLLLASASATRAHAKVVTKAVEYKDGSTVLEGYLAYDDAQAARRPGVLVVHEWMGIQDHTRHATEELAKLGYVAFAADVYGKGVRPPDAKAAAAEAGKYKGDRALFRRRVNLALDTLKAQKGVDDARLAAIGYCFGGSGVLELARSGAPVKGVVTFHGALDTPTPADAKSIKGRVLALHGGDDPYVPADQVAAFVKEMKDAGVDWQLVEYGGAVHSFTNPAAGTDNSKGAAYNERAATRAWEEMKRFMADVFR